jgi:hypothetical protein
MAMTEAELCRILGQRDAAQALGVSRQRVHQLRRRHGVAAPRAEAKAAQVVRLLRRGLSPADAAAVVGCSASWARRLRRTYGIPVRPRPTYCGTRAGYAAHLRRQEPACLACLAANRVAPGQGRPERAERRRMVMALLGQGVEPEVVARATGMTLPWVRRMARYGPSGVIWAVRRRPSGSDRTDLPDLSRE